MLSRALLYENCLPSLWYKLIRHEAPSISRTGAFAVYLLDLCSFLIPFPCFDNVLRNASTFLLFDVGPPLVIQPIAISLLHFSILLNPSSPLPQSRFSTQNSPGKPSSLPPLPLPPLPQNSSRYCNRKPPAGLKRKRSTEHELTDLSPTTRFIFDSQLPKA